MNDLCLLRELLAKLDALNAKLAKREAENLRWQDYVRKLECRSTSG